jgi:DNA-binding MarR family transcriptional regulator
LEKQDLVRRRRPADNQRSVEVQITDAGRQLYRLLDEAGSQMISDLLDHIPKERQETIVIAMEELAELLKPSNEAFQKLLKHCRCNLAVDRNHSLISIQ